MPSRCFRGRLMSWKALYFTERCLIFVLLLFFLEFSSLGGVGADDLPAAVIQGLGCVVDCQQPTVPGGPNQLPTDSQPPPAAQPGTVSATPPGNPFGTPQPAGSQPAPVQVPTSTHQMTPAQLQQIQNLKNNTVTIQPPKPAPAPPQPVQNAPIFVPPSSTTFSSQPSVNGRT